VKTKWPHARYAAWLLAVYAVLFLGLAIAPRDRATWVLEIMPAVIGVALLILTRNSFPLSRVSYTLLFVFLCLHTLGAHFTYSAVPYDEWSQTLLGKRINALFGWERNHFDRLVHFCYGLLVAYPVREVFLRIAGVRGFWGYFLPLDLTMSTSMIYELIEWGLAEVVGSNAGNAYLGSQGDPWDAQKDMALASCGALLAMLITAAINWKCKRDFAHEFTESLRIKRRRPLGEEALVKPAASA
jgi:putative membrane protein